MSTKEKNKNNIFGIFFISAFLLFFIYTQLNNKKIDQEIEKYKKESIAKIYDISSTRGGTFAKYYYYYNGKKYDSAERIETSGDELLFNFFKVYISTKNPEHNTIFLNKMINDTIAIGREGFEHVITYESKFNQNTNSYKMIKKDFGFK